MSHRLTRLLTNFPAAADEPSTTPSQSAPPQVAAELAQPQPAAEKKFLTAHRPKVPAADSYNRADQRVAARRESVENREPGVRGAEPVAAEHLPVPPTVPEPVEGPQPPKGDEVLPDCELPQEARETIRTSQASLEALPHRQ